MYPRQAAAPPRPVRSVNFGQPEMIPVNDGDIYSSQNAPPIYKSQNQTLYGSQNGPGLYGSQNSQNGPGIYGSQNGQVPYNDPVNSDIYSSQEVPNVPRPANMAPQFPYNPSTTQNGMPQPNNQMNGPPLQQPMAAPKPPIAPLQQQMPPPPPTVQVEPVRSQALRTTPPPMPRPMMHAAASPQNTPSPDWNKDLQGSPGNRGGLDDSTLSETSDPDRLHIRSEADKIAARLKKTELELERLRKQGDLIGENLRKQRQPAREGTDILASMPPSNASSLASLPSNSNGAAPAAPKSPTEPWRPSAPAGSPQESSIPTVTAMPSNMQTINSFPSAEEAPRVQAPAPAAPVRAAAPPPAAAPPAEADPPPSAAPLPATIAALPPQVQDNPELVKNVLSEQELSVLGLPPGTMWFDGSEAQVKMIQDQIAQSKAMAQNAPQPQAQAQAQAPPQPNMGQAQAPAPQAHYPNLLGQPQAPASPDGSGPQPYSIPSTSYDAPPPTYEMSPPHGSMPMAGMPQGEVDEYGARVPIQFKTGKRVKIAEGQIQQHMEMLRVPGDNMTSVQIIRAYKMAAMRAHPSNGGSEEELDKVSQAYMACQAAVKQRSQSKVGELMTIGEDEEDENDGEKDGEKEGEKEEDTSEVVYEEADAMALYEEMFHLRQKHGELKVELGVSLEDLLHGHTSEFEFDRTVTTEDGKTLSERCHLAIPISPGMRPGTQFIFEFEGDDGPGIVPGDVKVVLYAEPHTRFLSAGDDIATETAVSLADALVGKAIGPIHALTGESLMLRPPPNMPIIPGMSFKVPGQGLPLPDNPELRGALFVRVHVRFPPRIDLSEEETKVLEKVLASSAQPGERNVHSGIQPGALDVEMNMVPTPDTEFGAGCKEPPRLLCAQQ